MKLYEVPRNTWVRLKENPQIIFKFGHIDGMYSYCWNEKKEVIHVIAWEEVEIIPDQD